MSLADWQEIAGIGIVILWGVWVRGLWVREQSGTATRASRRDRMVLWTAAVASAVVIIAVAGDITGIAIRVAILAVVIASLLGLGQRGRS